MWSVKWGEDRMKRKSKPAQKSSVELTAHVASFGGDWTY
jgi:hypothetical protein